MRQNVQTLVQFFNSANIEIDVHAYPAPSPLHAAIAQGVFLTQLLLIASCVLHSKYQEALVAWLVGNFVRQMVTQSGAFEIWYGNLLIWSSLVEGRLPSLAELSARLSGLVPP
jgi:hypothetical protein